jgi:signal transduction histidine kinase
VTVRRRDEIGELATEMNGMCDRLVEAQARIAAEADAKAKAVEQLRHADRLRTVGTLASGMAHELGTPLSIIAGRAKMAAAPDATRADVAQYAASIGAQVERLTRIVRGLLDFARRKETPRTRGDVRDVARRTVELLEPMAKKNDVTLRFVPGAAEVRTDAEMDAVQVEQALANLVVNGIQASGGRGADLVVEVARATRDGRDVVTVEVRDRGDGIAPEDLPRVFEPFFTTKDVGEGTGLGLSVVYGILQDHGGSVEVESVRGEGSRFTLILPASDVA